MRWRKTKSLYRPLVAGSALVVLVMLLAGLPSAAQGKKTALVGSKHDLSIPGGGTTTLDAGGAPPSDTCIYCHTPHLGLVIEKPLWNHQLSIQQYNLYTSSTLSAAIQQPNQPSKQCLSCHDGTVALGQTVAQGLVATRRALGPPSLLGTDLRSDHPTSFTPTDDGQLAPSLFQFPPGTTDSEVKLVAGRVECTTCHDAHRPNGDPVVAKFLVRSNASSALCLACHDASRPQPNRLSGWVTGAHRTATNATPSGSTFGSYGTVAANACLNCHLPHSGPSSAGSRLLRNIEEAACSRCHDGSSLTPPLQNVMGEFSKTYAHPTIALSGLHDASENASPLNANRHAECVDCHNSHAASNTGGGTTPPAVQSALLGATGVDSATGAASLQPAASEYEICFKCHANSANKPQATLGFSNYGRTPHRVTDDTSADPYNTRLEFNSSFARHPVTQPRFKSSAEAPSVRNSIINLDGTTGRPLGAGTYVYCTDCHSNNSARVSKGTGPNGPHGSLWPHLLERRYDTEAPPAAPGGNTAGVRYSAGLNGSYALCYKCHDLDNSILQDRSFKEHNKHIQGENAACSTCHDSHGVQGGSATNNYSSINFDLAIVGPSSSGILRFERTGAFSGRCFLTCHGKNHNPESY